MRDIKHSYYSWYSTNNNFYTFLLYYIIISDYIFNNNIVYFNERYGINSRYFLLFA